MPALAFFVPLERTWLGLLPVLFERPLFLIIRGAVFEIMAKNSVIAGEKLYLTRLFFSYIEVPIPIHTRDGESLCPE